MLPIENLCMNCMRLMEPGKSCHNCNFPRDFVQESPGLALRTILNGRYVVGKALEFGGDGISYAGFDTFSGKPVRLREFFPDALARRNDDGTAVAALDGFDLAFTSCLDSFRALWCKLEQMRGLSGLLPVLAVFEENGTVYAVREAFEGSTLREYLLLRSETGTLQPDAAHRLISPLLPALSALHSAGVLHLGISPSSVIVTPDRKIYLTGFSVWQARTAGGGLRSELYPGYAAPEQYGLTERQGPWTDVYAAAGLYYRVLVGSDPIEATLRVRNDRLMIPGKLAEQIPAYVINALTNALEINPQSRTESIELFKAEINAAPEAVWADAAASSPTTGPKRVPETAIADVDEKNASTPDNTRIIFKTAAMTLLIFLIAAIGLCLTVFRGDILDLLSPKNSQEPQVPIVTNLPPGNYEVPDFVTRGISYNDIISNEVWTQQFKFVAENEYSATVKEGQIIAQSVSAGNSVPQGTVIILTVSNGQEMVSVPEYIGYLIDDIRGILEDAGFVVNVVIDKNDGTRWEGEVGSGSLEEGKQYPRGTTLYLHVYGPSELETETEYDTQYGEESQENTTTQADNGGIFPWWPF